MGAIQRIINSKIIERTKRKLALSSGIYFKIKKLAPSASEEYRTVKLLTTYKIDKVIDIGANTGQFAESLIDFGFKGEIISFEPVSSAYIALQKRAKKYNNWKIAEKCAIGNSNGKIKINVSENTVFSSIKNISKDYVSYNNDSKQVSFEEVNIFTLDSLKNNYLNKNENLFIKIDTQGFEKEVLEGAEETLKYVKGIKLEIPLRPIYNEVEWGIKEYINFFYDKGFECLSLEPVAVNNKNGIVYEVDGIFFKK
ncbi:MAG: FkbM family methyltransferase [Bacteroidetes bacterium]|nr:FkbM family methyltransferase [Bacteroidota bacterium]